MVVPIDGISRRHCELMQREGVRLRDLGSTNGTWLNGRELEPGEEALLQTGDRVELVGVAFKFLAGNDLEAQYHEELYQLAIVDGLTRTFNRRYLMDFLSREISRCRRHARPLSLLLFDIDRFKQINDRFGHAAGDHVLRTIVEVAREGVRREECLARFGGDEFAVVMPETELAGARIVAERTRGRVELHTFEASGRADPRHHLGRRGGARARHGRRGSDARRRRRPALRRQAGRPEYRSRLARSDIRGARDSFRNRVPELVLCRQGTRSPAGRLRFTSP